MASPDAMCVRGHPFRQDLTFYNYPDDYERSHVIGNLGATYIPSKGNV